MNFPLKSLQVWLAALLIAMGLVWSSVQTLAANNENLAWLICSPHQSFDLTPSQQKALQTISNLAGLDAQTPTPTTTKCPFQGCFGSQTGFVVTNETLEIVFSSGWAFTSTLGSNYGFIAKPRFSSSSHSVRAPPAQVFSI